MGQRQDVNPLSSRKARVPRVLLSCIGFFLARPIDAKKVVRFFSVSEFLSGRSNSFGLMPKAPAFECHFGIS
jgi:hypothetical protein